MWFLGRTSTKSSTVRVMSGAQFPFFQPQVPHPPTLSDLMASIQRLGRTSQIWTPCQSDAQTFEIF